MEQRNGWTVNLSACQVWHESGLSITFEGNPGSSHFGGSPSCPEVIPHHRFLALVREGFQFYRRCYGNAREEGLKPDIPPPGGRTPIIIRRRSRRILPDSPDTQ